jgi:protocatechuate 3,4-dioxygenase beta subunit
VRVLCLCLVAALTDGGQTPPRDARPAARAPSGSTLHGVVLDEEGRAVTGAVIMLRGGPPPGVATVVTDARGLFRFTTLAAGSFRLAATHPGYPPVEYGQTRPGSAPAAIVLGDGANETVTVRMPRGAVIAGTVVNEAGQPSAEAAVSARREDGDRDFFAGPATWTATDRAGRYRLTGLAAGTYLVTSTRSRTFSRETDPRADDIRVTLRPGAEQGGVDLRLPPVLPTGPIKVMPSGLGADVRFLETRLMTADRRRRSGLSCMRDPDGSCTFSDIPAGRHLLAGRAPAGQSMLWGSTELTFDGQGPLVVPLTLSPGVRISGRAEFEGASRPPDSSRAVVRLKPEADSAFDGLTTTGDVSYVRPDGSFEIRSVPPGRYTITVDEAPEPWIVESARLGDIDALDRPIELQHDDVAGLVLTFTDVRTEVSGLVTRGGRPVGAYELIAFPVAELFSSRRIQVTRSDTAGRYAFHGLPPGDYAVAHVPSTLMDDPASRPETLSTLTRLATVTLTRGARTSRALAVR